MNRIVNRIVNHNAINHEQMGSTHAGWHQSSRVAVSGWSYGGYMALKCLCGRPDVFQAAVSGAPVTDWALYDTVSRSVAHFASQ